MEIHFSTNGEQCKDGDDWAFRPGMASNESSLVGLQVRHTKEKRDEGNSMEKCTTAISSGPLMRIRPKPLSLGEKDVGSHSDIDLNDGEQEHPQVNSSVPPNNRVQLPLACKRHEYGSTSVLHYPDAGERVLHGDDTPDRMEFEGGGSIPSSS